MKNEKGLHRVLRNGKLLTNNSSHYYRLQGLDEWELGYFGIDSRDTIEFQEYDMVDGMVTVVLSWKCRLGS